MTAHAQPAAALPGVGTIPLLGFGTWQATGKSGYEAVKTALDTGYRHIDTATIYGNERQVGAALRDSGVTRESVFLTTKVPPDRVGHARQTLEESLSALGVDQVDLWLIHWPPARGQSERLWRELIAARDAGLTRAIGVSNYSITEIDQLVKATGELPVLNQIKWGPPLYDAKVQAAHRERGIVLEGYSAFRVTKLNSVVLTEIAQRHGVTGAQVVLRWHVQHETVVIPKSVTPQRIRANFDIFGFTLTEQEMSRIDSRA